MKSSIHFCMHSLRQVRHVMPCVLPKYCTARIQFLAHVGRCRKLSAATLSQKAVEKSCNGSKGVKRVEVLLIKNLFAGNKFEHGKDVLTKATSSNIAVVEKRPCTLENRHCHHEIVWQDVLLRPDYAARHDEILKEHSNLIGLRHEIWYCPKTDDICQKTPVLEFSIMDRMQCSKTKDISVTQRATRSGPSSEQLSLVLLRLREELPHFFDGHHRYSIYSKDILFVNKMTRTTTRTLKSYKYIMNLMVYAGKLFWTKASLDILCITKDTKDNTIKVRWTAKGMPWYQLPFLLLSGKPQSLFYRYVDGFSIFEVGRDGLVHCHRLDKVIPTSTPERQKWSLRMQILTLLGLSEITHEPCEAFRVKTQEMLK